MATSACTDKIKAMSDGLIIREKQRADGAFVSLLGGTELSFQIIKIKENIFAGESRGAKKNSRCKVLCFRYHFFSIVIGEVETPPRPITFLLYNLSFSSEAFNFITMGLDVLLYSWIYRRRGGLRDRDREDP